MSRPGVAFAALAASTLTIMLAGCSGGAADSACPAPIPAPPGELALMPAGLSFDHFGTVTHVVGTEGHLTVKAVSAKPIDEITILIQDAVTAAGYRPAGMDNEGFEAEVFFTSGQYAAGQALVRRAECNAQWNIDLVLVDPGAVPPTPSSAPSAATTP